MEDKYFAYQHILAILDDVVNQWPPLKSVRVTKNRILFNENNMMLPYVDQQ